MKVQIDSIQPRGGGLMVTGVCESWYNFDPNASPSRKYDTHKRDHLQDPTPGEFRRWLVSNSDLTAPESRDFVTTAWTVKTIDLVGNGSLGNSPPTLSKVTGGLVPVSKTKQFCSDVRLTMIVDTATL